MSEPTRRVARRKSATAPKTRPPVVEQPAAQKALLMEGDHIEFSCTSAFKSKRGEFWVKAGASTTIRPGETDLEAHERITTYVYDVLATESQNLQT